MLAGLFLNPGFLFIAAALISVPIIIHLINRMRFKRIRWAAMEFLLKAQKRTRRRLIIEQLLLLALRCLLIALVGLLVSRFVGCGDSNTGGKPNLHIALVDDTLSMHDSTKQEGVPRSAFDVAKNDILIKKIAKGLSLSKTNDRFILLPLSKADDDEFELPTYDRLNDKKNLDKLTTDINELQPTVLHVNMMKGIKRAQKTIAQYPESRVTLHVLSDFRSIDWSGKPGEALAKELVGLATSSKETKVRVIDCVLPPRVTGQGGYPKSNENIGIVNVQPKSRVVGHRMPVRFTVQIMNSSSTQVEARLVVFNEITGKQMFDVDVSPSDHLKLSPSSITEVVFEYGGGRTNPFFQDNDIKPGESKFAHLSVRLVDQALNPLTNDGLLPDNIRHTTVEVRDKVPILVIDGDGSNTNRKPDERDSFFLGQALAAVPGSSFQIVYGHETNPGNPTKALERGDLSQFPTIFLLNVSKLTPKQLANLENFVKEGGGVGFYMGANVDLAYYNKSLYKEAEGLFPAPIKQIYPPITEKELADKETDVSQLIIRDEKVPDWKKLPIFGEMFDEPGQRDPLRNLSIRRYMKIDVPKWKRDKVLELGTLPNEDQASSYGEVVASLTEEAQSTALKEIRANKELARFMPLFNRLLNEVREKGRQGSEFKAYQLAATIDVLLNAKGDPSAKPAIPDMPEFWSSSDQYVRSLHRQFVNLKDQVNYGDPFVLTKNFGKGKVVAVLSTAGKDWNNWPGGSSAQVLYQPFISEMQKYLSSPGSEANLTVGTEFDIAVDAEQFKNAQLKMVRKFRKTFAGGENPEQEVEHSQEIGRPEGGQVHFSVRRNLIPGLYRSELKDENLGGKTIATWAHAFNVDTEREGYLSRIGNDELENLLINPSKAGNGDLKFGGPGAPDTDLVARTNDFSESPWLYLILLLVLVAEQALAVHLSFHLRSTENEMLPAGAGAKV